VITSAPPREQRAGLSTSRWVPVLVIVGISAVLHLWKLDLRPLAHDESIDAFFSWQARDWGVMRYDPVYHGPLRFYLEGPVLATFGTGAFWARFVAAMAGIAATGVIAASTRTLGRVGAPVAAIVFMVSPTVLTVTRTGREDSLVVLVSLGLLLLVARALTRPRAAHLVGAGALLAASFGLKESTFLFGFTALLFFVGAGAVAALRPSSRSRAAVQRLRAMGSQPWAWAVIAFTLTFIVVFTSAFRYSAGLESGLLDGLRYWWSQHDVGRGGQPWFFHLAIYAAYEWLLVGLAVAGLVVSVRRRSLVGAWFATMAIGQVVLYSWAGEKFAWLAVHPLVPAVLLGGLGAQAISEHLRTRRSQAVVASAGLVVVGLTAVVAARPAITDGADPRELLVTVQTSDDVPPVVDELVQAHREGRIDTIAVDQTGGGAWPWAWYLHGLDGVQFITLDSQDLPTDYDAMVVFGIDGEPVVPEGYRSERFSFREWWVPDYDNASAGDLLTWWFTRETWSPTASLDQYLVIRDDL
jgi:uncharacterized protein (TIGR03663 family)